MRRRNHQKKTRLGTIRSFPEMEQFCDARLGRVPKVTRFSSHHFRGSDSTVAARRTGVFSASSPRLVPLVPPRRAALIRARRRPVAARAPSRPRTMVSAPNDAGPNKRLVIKKMVLENFKSYAGAQHVGPFHKVRHVVVVDVAVDVAGGVAGRVDVAARLENPPGRRDWTPIPSPTPRRGSPRAVAPPRAPPRAPPSFPRAGRCFVFSRHTSHPPFRSRPHPLSPAPSRSLSPPWLVLTVAASPTSSTRCFSCSASAPSSFA